MVIQVLMFSATLHSEEVTAAADRLCQNPILVDLKVTPPPLQSLCQKHVIVFHLPRIFHIRPLPPKAAISRT